MADAFATIKKPGDLKAGDVTPFFFVLEDAEPGTNDDGLCVVVKIQWHDDRRLDFRVWDDLNAEVEVRGTLTKAELQREMEE